MLISIMGASVDKNIINFNKENQMLTKQLEEDKQKRMFLRDDVDFYDFPYKGKIARMYKKQYIEDRTRQLNDKQPNEFLDAFRESWKEK
jgi:hypothetical protein